MYAYTFHKSNSFCFFKNLGKIHDRPSAYAEEK